MNLPETPGAPQDNPEALAALDAVLAGVGLRHGRRGTRTGTWRDAARTRPETDAVVRRPRSTASDAGLLRVPAWSGLPWLVAGFSTRQGGQTAVYGGRDEQNLGWTKHDPEMVVAGNRRRFFAAVSAGKALEPVQVRQFHSGMIRVIGEGDLALAGADGRPLLRGDGLMTARSGLLLGVVTADCVPVLVADTRTHAVAAFHAGWRGTLARIVERGIGTMQLEFGSRPEDLVAVVGPAIGACCFAVGEEVRFEFESQFGYAPELFSEVYDSDPVREKYPLLFMTARAPGHSNIGPQIHLDLHEGNRRQLLDAGVPAQRIEMLAECTACSRLPDGRRTYFSHRAEQGFTGRMLSVIGTV